MTLDGSLPERSEALAAVHPVPFLPPEPPSWDHADKLYIITRADLSAGYQSTQAVHAAADFCFEHPTAAARWHQVSNSVVVLAAPDLAALHAFRGRLVKAGITHTLFREPDLGDELTAIAVTPGDSTRRICSNFPLAGRRHDEQLQASALERERALRETTDAMRACEQTAGQDVLAHGRSVREHYLALLDHLAGRVDLSQAPNWRLPSWLDRYAGQLAAEQVREDQADRYLTLHDCGKSAVRTVGEDGKVRFPGHAPSSAAVYAATAAAGGRTPDPVVAELIATDMDMHLLTGEQVAEFAARATAPTLLLSALAEISSNAAMFGGISSTSFKIKFKHLERRGRQVCQARWGAPDA